MTLYNGIKDWAFGSTQYVQSAVNNVEEYLRQKCKSLNAKGLDILLKNYYQEIDISEELGTQEDSYFQYLLGIFDGWLNWEGLIYVLIPV